MAALLAAAALTSAGCSEGKKSVATTTAATVTTHGRFQYPPSLVENFMRSCTRGDSSKRAYCACTLDRLSNNVSTDDFTRIGRSGGRVPPRIRRLIRRATVACLHKL